MTEQMPHTAPTASPRPFALPELHEGHQGDPGAIPGHSGGKSITKTLRVVGTAKGTLFENSDGGRFMTKDGAIISLAFAQDAGITGPGTLEIKFTPDPAPLGYCVSLDDLKRAVNLGGYPFSLDYDAICRLPRAAVIPRAEVQAAKDRQDEVVMGDMAPDRIDPLAALLSKHPAPAGSEGEG